MPSRRRILGLTAAAVALLAAAFCILARQHASAAVHAAVAVPVFDHRLQAALASNNIAQLQHLRAEVESWPDGSRRDTVIAQLETALGANAQLKPQPPQARVPDLDDTPR